MISDLQEAKDTSFLQSDVCVIGSGAAGITIARKLAEQGKTVTLCEAGSLEFTERSQEIYRGDIKGDPYFQLDVARLRYFGGTTNHWEGYCRTFDAIDFDRSYISEAYKWPISKKDIDPFFEEACAIVDISPSFPESQLGQTLRTITVNVSLPTRFASKYMETIKASGHINMVINANFVDVDVKDRKISAGIFRSYNGRKLSVHADTFVLATGGIENSRLLLWLHRNRGDELYDGRLPVGAYWMEHPEYALGSALVDNDVAKRVSYSLTEDVQKDMKVLNCGIFVRETPGSTAKQLVKDLLCVAPRYGKKMAQLVGKNLACGALLESAWEQEPLKSNRVVLSSSKFDKIGIPRPVLIWKKGPFDRRTMVASVEIFNQWLLDQDLGRLKLADWVMSDAPYPKTTRLGSYHHMGGTRMGENAETSVVDANCRVHDTENLYIAGSSVFATGGHNNPTLPIVQLSLRLAQHIAQL